MVFFCVLQGCKARSVRCIGIGGGIEERCELRLSKPSLYFRRAVSCTLYLAWGGTIPHGLTGDGRWTYPRTVDDLFVGSCDYLTFTEPSYCMT